MLVSDDTARGWVPVSHLPERSFPSACSRGQAGGFAKIAIGSVEKPPRLLEARKLKDHEIVKAVRVVEREWQKFLLAWTDSWRDEPSQVTTSGLKSRPPEHAPTGGGQCGHEVPRMIVTPGGLWSS